ncbi:MAG TPA: hemerythrin domain-containing protein [Candidatus Eisenbacteria bacterium]
MNVRDPIDRLLAEHEEIMAEVAELRRAVRDLDARGEAALPEATPALERVGQMMATRLLEHARREDEALFPALEEVLGAGGPTGVMRLEHEAIHEQAALFRRTLRELNEVEHPAIVRGGGRLRTLVATGGDAASLSTTGAEIVRLLDGHFSREEAILFPMARQILSPEALEDVARRMEALDGA